MDGFPHYSTPLYKWMFQGHPPLLWVTHNCAIGRHMPFPMPSSWGCPKENINSSKRAKSGTALLCLLTPHSHSQASTNNSLDLLNCSRSWFGDTSFSLCHERKLNIKLPEKCQVCFISFFSVGRIRAHRTSLFSRLWRGMNVYRHQMC